MYKGKSVAVVVPAFNEEQLLGETLSGIPEFVDWIVVVNDASTDGTLLVAERAAKRDQRIVVISHSRNRGVGAAVSSGYIWCRGREIDAAAVMAGDNQMDPQDLPALLDPIVENRADYAKGNRLVSGEAWRSIPRLRYLGNSALTFATKIVSGYWHVTDSQTGYTVLNKRGLKLLPLEQIYPRYGMPNDFLVTANIYGMRVLDVPVRPVYRIGERSGIVLQRDIFLLTWLLLRLFRRRMIEKYVIRDFHPLVLFYIFGIFLLCLDLPLGFRLLLQWRIQGVVPQTNAIAILFCTVLGFQSVLFAMLFDMEANKDLKGEPSY